MNETPPKKAGWKAKLGLLVFSIALIVITGEIGLRVVGYRPPEILTAEMKRTYKMHQPGAEFVYRGYLDGMFSDFATPVKFNSLGFHDVQHTEVRANTNTFRLMVIGDSYVAALSCPLETTFFRRLEEKLNKEDPLGRGSYEVLAFGQGNQAQEKETAYVTKFGPVYRPDAVLLLFFCGNDFMENSPETFKEAGKFATMYQRNIAKRKETFFNRVFLVRGSRFNGLVAEGLTTFYANHLHWFTKDLKQEDLISPELGVYRSPLDPMWQRAYDRTGELLANLNLEVAKLGVPLLVAGLSGPQAIGDVGHAKMAAGAGGLDSLQPARWLEAWCKSNSVPFVALEPELSAASKRRVFWRHDGHLNTFGNEVIVAPVQKLVVESMAKP